MKWIPAIEERIADAHKQRREPTPLIIPKAPDYYANNVTYVDSAEKAKDMLELALQRPISHVIRNILHRPRMSLLFSAFQRV